VLVVIQSSERTRTRGYSVVFNIHVTGLLISLIQHEERWIHLNTRHLTDLVGECITSIMSCIDGCLLCILILDIFLASCSIPRWGMLFGQVGYFFISNRRLLFDTGIPPVLSGIATLSEVSMG
jgi:hypothetical protein